MTTEFTVTLQNRPGAMAELAETLAKSGINIIAIHGTPCDDEGYVQFVTDNTDATVNALQMAGIESSVRQVLLVTMVDQPGALARVARALAEAGINLNSIYIAMNSQIVLDVDNIDIAQKIVLGLGAA